MNSKQRVLSPERGGMHIEEVSPFLQEVIIRGVSAID